MAKKTSSRASMRDRMRERSTTREQAGRGGVKFKFPEGAEIKFFKIDKACTKKLDFIPYEVTAKNHPAGVEVGDLWYQRTIWTHNGIGPEEKAYLCLKTVGKKCPICDYAAQLQKDPKSDDELIKSLKAKERELFQVIDHDDKDEAIQLWEYSYHLFGKLLEEEIRNAEPSEDYKAGFADLEGGSTLKIRFEKKTMGKNEFYEVKRIDFMERDDLPESVLDDVLDLDEILNVLPYEKLEGIFLDTEPEPEEKPRGRSKKEEKEDDEPPARGKRGAKEEEKPSRRGKKEEPEEEDEPPARGKRGAKKEEEEAPARGRRGAKKEPESEPEEDEECIGGGTYGEDEGGYDECMDCEVWEQCKKLSDEKKASKKRGRK